MPRFEITMEARCSHNRPDIDCAEIDAESIAAMNDAALAAGFLEDAATELRGIQILDVRKDAGNSSAAVIAVTLEAKAPDHETAEGFEMDEGLARLVFDEIAREQKIVVTQAGDWEATEVKRL